MPGSGGNRTGFAFNMKQWFNGVSASFSRKGDPLAYMKYAPVKEADRILSAKRKAVEDLQSEENSHNASHMKLAKRRQTAVRTQSVAELNTDVGAIVDAKQSVTNINGEINISIDHSDTILQRKETAKEQVASAITAYEEKVVAAKRKYDEETEVQRKKFKTDKAAVQKENQRMAAKRSQAKQKQEKEEARIKKRLIATAEQQKEEAAAAAYEDRRYVTTPCGKKVMVDTILNHGKGWSFEGEIKTIETSSSSSSSSSSMRYKSEIVFAATPGAKVLVRPEIFKPNESIGGRLGYVLGGKNYLMREMTATQVYPFLDVEGIEVTSSNSNNSNESTGSAGLAGSTETTEPNQNVGSIEITDTTTVSVVGTKSRDKEGTLVWMYPALGTSSVFNHQGSGTNSNVPANSERYRAKRKTTINMPRKDGGATQYLPVVDPEKQPGRRQYAPRNKKGNQTAQKIIDKLQKDEQCKLFAGDLEARATTGWDKNTQDHGQIWDTKCKKNLPLDFSRVKMHFVKDEHKKNVQKCDHEAKHANKNALKEHYERLEKERGKGGQVPANSVKMRMDMVMASLKAFMGINKLDILTPVLERHTDGQTMGNVTDLNDLLKDLHPSTLKGLADETAEFLKYIAVIIDATTLAKEEKTAILIRMMDKNRYIQQRLIAIVATKHHVKGKQQAKMIRSALKRIGLSIKQLIALIADRAATNGVTADEIREGTIDEEEAEADLIDYDGELDALELLEAMRTLPEAEGEISENENSSSSSSSSTAVTQLADTRKLCLFLVGCFSHTFDKIGKKFDAPELVEFMNAVRGLTNKSNVAQRLFCTLAPDGKNLVGYAAIRWWNDWIQQVQIQEIGIDKILGMAHELKSQDLCRASAMKIIELCENPKKRARVEVQLARSIEEGRIWCSFGFDMEGNSPLSLVVGKKLKDAVTLTNPNLPRPISDAAAAKAASIVASSAQTFIDNIDSAKKDVDAVEKEITRRRKKIEKLSTHGGKEKPVLSVSDVIVGPKQGKRGKRYKGVVTLVHDMRDDGTQEYNIKYDHEIDEKEHESEKSIRLHSIKNRDANAAEVQSNRIQQVRLATLAKEKIGLVNTLVQLKGVEKVLAEAKTAAASFGPITIAEWKAYGRTVVEPGLAYMRKRFVDTGTVFSDRGSKAVNAGLTAVRAFSGAIVFNPAECCTMSSDEFIKHIKSLKYFDFVTEAMINAAIEEAPSVLLHMQQHRILPPVDLKDERTMQTASERKKVDARRSILERRRKFVEAESLDVVGDVNDAVAAINGAINDDDVASKYDEPPSILDLKGRQKSKKKVNELKVDQKRTNKEAYSIMEWWRIPSSNESTAALPRYEAFPAFGGLLEMIALCLPSSAPAERIFSLLKLVLSKQDFSKLVDNYETAMLLRVNDVDI